jgi:deoxyguanosine kinase
MLPAPNLILYLRASIEVLQQRISQRGRDYERDISTDYLVQLSGLYDQWADNFSFCPLVTVETDALNFVTEAAHLEQIAELIETQLHKQSGG